MLLTSCMSAWDFEDVALPVVLDPMNLTRNVELQVNKVSEGPAVNSVSPQSCVQHQVRQQL